MPVSWLPWRQGIAAAEADPETLGLVPASATVAESYGAATPDTKAGESPLLLGRFATPPETLLRVLVRIYVAFFLVNIVADLVYFITVDARFPKGLGYLYPSEWERRQSVSYTRHILAIGMLNRTTIFGIVLLCIHFRVFARLDEGMRMLAQLLAEQWDQITCERCCGDTLGGILRSGCSLLFAPCQCLATSLQRCCCACCCGCSPVRRLFAEHNAKELLHGSVYLAVFTGLFFLLNAPFMYCKIVVDLKFGFANALTVTVSKFRRRLFADFFSVTFWSIPGRFVYLAILRFRLGWLFMWSAGIVVMVIAHYNFSMLGAAFLGAKNVFPSDAFAVGRGFPLASTSYETWPWVSMNRIFFNVSDPSTLMFATEDKSKGPLVLKVAPNGSWAILDGNVVAKTREVYARTLTAVTDVNASVDKLLKNLDGQRWDIGDASTRLGVRSGKALRDKVMGFARERNISIAEIFMVDGSHKDARANAFVGGVGGSIIGLFDTLFLGQHANDDEAEETAPSALQSESDDDAGVLALSEVVQGVDIAEEDGKQGVWSSTPTQAMTDDEIIAILAHELAHPDLGHLQQGLLLQAATSLATYASLGWAVHSPIFAAALFVGTPLVHVGACAYGHLIGPSLDHAMKFFSDWLIRRNEYAADAYVARMSDKYGTALQTALAKLSVNSNQDPDMPSWYEALRLDHPTAANRWANIEAVKQEMARSERHG